MKAPEKAGERVKELEVSDTETKLENGTMVFVVAVLLVGHVSLKPDAQKLFL